MQHHALFSLPLLKILPELLMQLLLAIDLNDLIKTSQALCFFRSFLSLVPIFGIGDGSEALSYPPEISEEVAEARLSVVAILPDWAFSFLDRILEFVYFFLLF
jgi:hypothetical protein